jgi:hypothetical protein
MPKIELELTDRAKKQSTKTKSLAERAREAEEQWRAERGLSKGLHRKGNVKARERRRRAECPDEPKANVRHRRYREKRLGKLGAASEVRRIDPVVR